MSNMSNMCILVVYLLSNISYHIVKSRRCSRNIAVAVVEFGQVPKFHEVDVEGPWKDKETSESLLPGTYMALGG